MYKNLRGIRGATSKKLPNRRRFYQDPEGSPREEDPERLRISLNPIKGTPGDIGNRRPACSIPEGTGETSAWSGLRAGTRAN